MTKVIVTSNKKIRSVQVMSNKKERSVVVQRNITIELTGEQPYDVEYGGEEFVQ